MTDGEYIKTVSGSFHYDGIVKEEDEAEEEEAPVEPVEQRAPPQLFIVSPSQGDSLTFGSDLNIVFATKTHLLNTPSEELDF